MLQYSNRVMRISVFMGDDSFEPSAREALTMRKPFDESDFCYTSNQSYAVLLDF